MNKVFKVFTTLLFTLTTATFVAIIFYLIFKGVKSFSFAFLTNELLAPIEGTVVLVVLSTLIATIFGITTAIYIERYAKKRIKKILNLSFEILASMPSIIIGLFGFTILVALHKIFPNIQSSLLLSATTLAILTLPYIIKATQLGLQQVPKEFILVACATGATKEQTILKIELPFAKNHILKGIFLTIARSAEDTAVIMLTGVVASYGTFKSIFEPFEALPFFIYYTTTNYENESALNSIYVAIILLILISTTIMALIKATKWFR